MGLRQAAGAPLGPTLGCPPGAIGAPSMRKELLQGRSLAGGHIGEIKVFFSDSCIARQLAKQRGVGQVRYMNLKVGKDPWCPQVVGDWRHIVLRCIHLSGALRDCPGSPVLWISVGRCLRESTRLLLVRT